MYNLKNEVYV